MYQLVADRGSNLLLSAYEISKALLLCTLPQYPSAEKKKKKKTFCQWMNVTTKGMKGLREMLANFRSSNESSGKRLCNAFAYPPLWAKTDRTPYSKKLI